MPPEVSAPEAECQLSNALISACSSSSEENLNVMLPFPSAFRENFTGAENRWERFLANSSYS